MSVTPSAHRTPGLRVAITLWAGWPAALLVAAAALAAALVARLVIASGPPPLSYDAYAAVAAADLVGSLVAFTATIDERTNEVGYIGSKKWIRAVLTVSGSPGTGGPTAAIVIKGFPRTLPA